MAKTVKQSIVLPAPARDLYAMYLNPRTHAAITGEDVKISARPGSTFSASGGMLSGRTLQTIPGRLIVQAWPPALFAKPTSTRR